MKHKTVICCISHTANKKIIAYTIMIYTYTHLYIYCMQLQMYVYKTVIMRTVITDNLVYFFQGFEKDKCYIASQGNYS